MTHRALAPRLAVHFARSLARSAFKVMTVLCRVSQTVGSPSYRLLLRTPAPSGLLPWGVPDESHPTQAGPHVFILFHCRLGQEGGEGGFPESRQAGGEVE